MLILTHRHRAHTVASVSTRMLAGQTVALALLVRLTWTPMQLHCVMRALRATTLMLVLQCARRVSLASTTMIQTRARRVLDAAWATSLLRRLSIARYVLLASTTMMPTLPHRVTTMLLDARRVTTRMRGRILATPVLLDRPTWTVMRLHRAMIVWPDECRRLVKHRVQSVLLAQQTVIRIHRRRVWPVLPASSALSER